MTRSYRSGLAQQLRGRTYQTSRVGPAASAHSLHKLACISLTCYIPPEYRGRFATDASGYVRFCMEPAAYPSVRKCFEAPTTYRARGNDGRAVLVIPTNAPSKRTAGPPEGYGQLPLRCRNAFIADDDIDCWNVAPFFATLQFHPNHTVIRSDRGEGGTYVPMYSVLLSDTLPLTRMLYSIKSEINEQGTVGEEGGRESELRMGEDGAVERAWKGLVERTKRIEEKRSDWRRRDDKASHAHHAGVSNIELTPNNDHPPSITSQWNNEWTWLDKLANDLDNNFHEYGYARLVTQDAGSSQASTHSSMPSLQTVSDTTTDSVWSSHPASSLASGSSESSTRELRTRTAALSLANGDADEMSRAIEEQTVLRSNRSPPLIVPRKACCFDHDDPSPRRRRRKQVTLARKPRWKRKDNERRRRFPNA